MTDVTSHLAEDRWPLRGDANEDVLTVWGRALPLDVSLAPNGLSRVPRHDEARYDPVTQTVIFRRDNKLVTCYSVRRGEIPNRHGWAVLQAVEAQYGPVEEHSETSDCDSDMEFSES